jgi:hypothetical protein
MLAGCVDSAGPLRAAGWPVFGSRLPVHLYPRADGPACSAYVDTFRCGGAQCAVPGRPTPDIAALTLARYGGDDLLVLARSSRPDATRANVCTRNASSRCSITGRDAPIAVEATAARPDRKGHWRSASTGADASA